jgi:hypothetical protein
MNILDTIFSHYFALLVTSILLLRYRRSLAGFAGRLTASVKARAQLHRLPNRTRITALLVAVSITGLILLPGSTAGEIGHSASVKLRNWEMRAPAETCLAKKYTVTVAGATYYLPAAPVIMIRAGKYSYHFQSNRALRDICEKTPNAHDPIHAEILNLDFSIPMRGRFCQETQSRWSRELCDQEPHAADGAYPAIANIYSPEKYDRKHLMSGHTYANFIESRDKALAAKHPLEPQQIDSFERHANGYWVSRPGTWTNDAGDPFTLKCQGSAPAGALSCTTSYRLKSGPQVTYHFSARADKLEAAAREIDNNLHLMLEELSEP